MSAVDWKRLDGSGDFEAQCALLDELIDQTARVADEQRTANLIAFASAFGERDLLDSTIRARLGLLR